MPQRVYFHVDMDAFFVSVEELYDPSLKGKPVVVGGQAHERGVVAAASYAARKFGVHSALPLRTAAKLCPQAIFLDGHPERYRECSQKVYRVLQQFSPLVEMASIDEAYLDMTGTERLHGPPLRAAHLLHQAMKEQTKLNCSVGIASSRVVAKIGSDQAKPNGVLWIVPGTEAAFLGPLEIRRIPGIGKKTEERLNKLGVWLVSDIARMPEAQLRAELGEWGLSLAGKAQGLDAGGWFRGEIGDDDDPKSISHEHTFSVDTADVQQLESTLSRLSQMVCRRVREHGLFARRVQIKLRYTDFSTYTRARTLEHTTQLDQDVFDVARELLLANWEKGRTIRLIGVQASMFEEEAQMALIGDTRDKKRLDALNVADHLRDRFGEGVVALGTGLKSKLRERTHENPAALPGKHPKTK